MIRKYKTPKIRIEFVSDDEVFTDAIQISLEEDETPPLFWSETETSEGNVLY